MPDGYTERQARAAGMPGEVSASKMSAPARKATPAAGNWRLENVSAKLAENGGVIVNCSKRRENPPKDAGYDQTYQSKEYAFGGVDEALAYIESELRGGTPATTAGGASAAPPPQPA